MAAARPGESLRVFPLSDWTERDIWAYVARERLAVASLYFAAERPTVERDGTLLILDDDRFPLRDRRGGGDPPRPGPHGRLLPADRRGRERRGDDRARCSPKWRATAAPSAPGG